MGSDSFDWDIFFRDYWRRQPLVLRGGARSLVDLTLKPERFSVLANSVEALDPESVKRGGNGVVFVQNIDRADPTLASIASELRRTHGFYRPWFDAVLTENRSAGGIGCHYDNSDNFVLQQSGWKRWRIHSPDIIPLSERGQRMMNVPGVGDAFMPEHCFEVILEAGDLLYIPLLWPHWGLTAGESLSLSLVCNTTAPADLVASAIRLTLGAQQDGWNALPRVRDRADANALFDVFWQRLTSCSGQALVREAWVTALLPADAGHVRSPQNPPDFSLLREHALLKFPPIEIDALDAILPDASDLILGTLECRAAARRGQDLLWCLERICALTNAPQSVDTVRLLLEGCAQVSLEAFVSLLLQPGAGTWIARAAYDLRFAYGPRAIELTSWLPVVLRPFYQVAAQNSQFSLPLPAIGSAGISLLPEGLQVLPVCDRADDWRLEGGTDGLTLWDQKGPLLAPSRPELACGRVLLRPLEREGSLWRLDCDSWFDMELVGDAHEVHGDSHTPLRCSHLSLVAGTAGTRRPHPAYIGVVPVHGTNRRAIQTASAARSRMLLVIGELATQHKIPGVEPWAEWRGPAAGLVEVGLANWLGRTHDEVDSHFLKIVDALRNDSHHAVRAALNRLF